jgi:hypothetical protein
MMTLTTETYVDHSHYNATSSGCQDGEKTGGDNSFGAPSPVRPRLLNDQHQFVGIPFSTVM